MAVASSPREDNLYMAKLAEQAERFDEMVQFMDKVVSAADGGKELTVEERNLLAVAYKNVLGARRASWRIIFSIEQKEEGRGNDGHVSIIRDYRSKIESELSSICDGILKLLDSRLIGSASSGDSKVFYLKMKGDYYRYLAEFKTGSEKQEATENTLSAYKAAQDIANEELAPTDPIRLALNLSVNPEAPHTDSMDESPSPQLNAASRKKKRKAEASSTGKRQPWTIVDNELLTKGYLHVSNNCIVENNQKSSNFWKRVLEYYMTGESSGAVRTAHNLRSHWHMIKTNVKSFNNIMTQLRAQKRSGWSEDQLKAHAHKVYHEQHKTNFIHEHVWNLVKDDPNWKKQTDIQELKGIEMALVEYTTSSDAYLNADVDNINIPLSVEDCEVEEFPRPVGTKKAKAKRSSQGKGVEAVAIPLVNTVHKKVDVVEHFNVEMTQMLALKEKKLALQMHQTAMNEMEILYKDTSQMDSETLAFHKERCTIIREKYGKKKQMSPSVIF